MASSNAYLQYILGQLSELEEITYRPMMGEYIIYYRGKIVGGIYDDRLLVKPVKTAISYMPSATYELPYEGAKEMLLVDEVEDKSFLRGLFNAIYEDLPEPKKRKLLEMIEVLKKERFSAVSLSVQKENFAVKLYKTTARSLSCLK